MWKRIEGGSIIDKKEWEIPIFSDNFYYSISSLDISSNGSLLIVVNMFDTTERERDVLNYFTLSTTFPKPPQIPTALPRVTYPSVSGGGGEILYLSNTC